MQDSGAGIQAATSSGQRSAVSIQHSGTEKGCRFSDFALRIEWMQECRGALLRARVRGGETDRDESFRAWWASEKIVFNFLVVGTMKERKLNLIAEEKR